MMPARYSLSSLPRPRLRRSNKSAVLLGAVLVWVGSAASLAQDAPHSPRCSSCHIPHDLFGQQYESTVGADNVCLSCHVPGGAASASAFWDGDQAVIVPWQGTNTMGSGRSHRWDGSTSARVEGLSVGPRVFAIGEYAGRYPKSYLVTITTAGDVGAARFGWAADPPGAGNGTNLPLRVRVPINVDDEGYVTYSNAPAPLELGLALRFTGTAFQAGQQWRVYARPGVHAPASPALLSVMTEGVVSCSVCHDPHSQEETPFDPQAPEGGAGRHFMRISTPQDQLCAECHGPRFVTSASAGSHPVGLAVPTNSTYTPPASLPLDAQAGRIWCSTCHAVHNSASNDGRLLRAEHETALCAQCHKNIDAVTPARHMAPLNGNLWPGGQYGSLLPADTDPNHRGGCASCHRAHGWPDPVNPTNSYPNLLVEREENLCYTCHDGTPVGKDIRANFNLAYRHPVGTSGRHTAGEDGVPARYGNSNRHSECSDCHNVHRLDVDASPPAAPGASKNLYGVPRVAVTNISPGAVAYQFIPATDLKVVKEYEVCFTCHSGWTTQPAGQSNLAADFNAKNPSFHPVEAQGKNLNINPNAFVNGWNAGMMMTCSDCHTSSDTNIRGPHGSAYQYILKKQAIASAARRSTAMASTELCFDCHRYDTYANNSASSTVKNYSRFSGENGHAYHVGSRRYPCYSCHETHGSTVLPNLLVTGRNPGLNTYTRTASGGTCTATCHGSESYSVTYSR